MVLFSSGKLGMLMYKCVDSILCVQLDRQVCSLHRNNYLERAQKDC